MYEIKKFYKRETTEELIPINELEKYLEENNILESENFILVFNCRKVENEG